MDVLVCPHALGGHLGDLDLDNYFEDLDYSQMYDLDFQILYIRFRFLDMRFRFLDMRFGFLDIRFRFLDMRFRYTHCYA
jgi:hypothetical protein